MCIFYGRFALLPFLFFRWCFTPGRLIFKSFTDSSWWKLGGSRLLYPSNVGAAFDFLLTLLRTLWADISRDGITQIRMIILIHRIFLILFRFLSHFSLLFTFDWLSCFFFFCAMDTLNENINFHFSFSFSFSSLLHHLALLHCTLIQFEIDFKITLRVPRSSLRQLTHENSMLILFFVISQNPFTRPKFYFSQCLFIAEREENWLN